MAQSINERLNDLLLSAVETEIGGVEIYEKAVECAINEDLRKEWSAYREQTRDHVRVLKDLCASLGVNPDERTPGRDAVTVIGRALVEAMKEAGDDPATAQLVAGECVVLAETKDHLNWELLAAFAEKATGQTKKLLEEACSEVEEEEDEHLYHSAGWTRELWLEHLGLPAVLPPPEEEKNVKTAIGAERAKQQREEML